MKKSFLVVGSLVAICVFAPRVNAQNLVVNGSFENPTVNGFQYQPPSSNWYYGGGTGISANSGFQTAGAIPDGNQFCFVQGAGDYVSEQVTFPTSGMYALSYDAGGRTAGSSYGGNTNYGVYLGSSLLAAGTTTSNSAMTQQLDYFSASAGTQTLKLQVTGAAGDQTALFDAVSITPASKLVYTTPGMQSVTLPACTATIQCWGAGGKGSNGEGLYYGFNYGASGVGGGGGGYSEVKMTLLAGTYHFQVGQGGGTVGSSSPGTADSVWDWNGSSGGKEAWATGGATPSMYNGNQCKGGIDMNGVYLGGGKGGYPWSGNIEDYGGGGGGGAAGPAPSNPDYPGVAGGNGANAYADMGGAGGFSGGGGAGGQGGYSPYAGPYYSLAYAVGQPGTFPGGGGGGGDYDSYDMFTHQPVGYSGGAGAGGEIVITITVPEPTTLTLLVSALLGLVGALYLRRCRAIA